MKIRKIIFISIVCVMTTSLVFAEKSKMAQKADIDLLKKDLVNEQIKVGKTRVKKVLEAFGQPNEKEDSSKKIILKYGDVELEFIKQAFFRSWQYDYSHKTAYRDSIDDLRKDLEDGQIIGEYYTKKTLFKDYDEPTEAEEKYEDGQMSYYYYGELKLAFENVFLLSKWKGDKIGESLTDQVLQSGENASLRGVYQSDMKSSLAGVLQSKPKKEDVSGTGTEQ